MNDEILGQIKGMKAEYGAKFGALTQQLQQFIDNNQASADPELNAMRTCFEVLNPLEDAARERILTYLVGRWPITET